MRYFFFFAPSCCSVSAAYHVSARFTCFPGARGPRVAFPMRCGCVWVCLCVSVRAPALEHRCDAAFIVSLPPGAWLVRWPPKIFSTAEKKLCSCFGSMHKVSALSDPSPNTTWLAVLPLRLRCPPKARGTVGRCAQTKKLFETGFRSKSYHTFLQH